MIMRARTTGQSTACSRRTPQVMSHVLPVRSNLQGAAPIFKQAHLACVVAPAASRTRRAVAAQKVVRRPAAVCYAAVSALDRVSEPHLQLATARLPGNADPARFAAAMYQWAATMTQSGANLPFVSPLKADKLANGFQISMLMRSNKTKSFGSTADIVGTVEQQDGVGSVFMVRFYEGEVAQDNKSAGWQPPTDPVARLELVLDSCKDVDTIMANMPQAIRIAAKVSSPE